ncbi:MAG: cysS [Francisellaceae bacterium]|nr:cysS [Francisellaceae bacterium]
MLEIYNTLTQKKEPFKPIKENKLSIYVCGITVYDHCHIGHARMFLVFDMVVRYFKYLGYELKYVRNITDVDDKIIKKAFANNEPFNDLAKRYIDSMHQDEKALNLIPPTHEPKATEYIEQMINLIKGLIEKKHAYVAQNGDVYFDILSFESYGCLSHRSIDALQAGARVEVDEHKNNPLDFVLWKMTKPQEPFWDSPWGKGRPGWHIECSAMSLDTLGETFDIHGGGPDLKFPHHENERAQSECFTNKKFVNYWMHTGFVQKNKEKMSKSLNNFLTIKDFLKSYHSEVLRYFMLNAHYRSPIDYALEHIDVAKLSLERLYLCLRDLDEAIAPPLNHLYKDNFTKAMNDDFNTPIAFSVLFEIAKEINRLKAQNNFTEASCLGSLLRQLAQTLGLLNESVESFLKQVNTTEDIDSSINLETIESLIKERELLKLQKEWKKADLIRLELQNKGIILEDTPQGTVWRR